MALRKLFPADLKLEKIQSLLANFESPGRMFTAMGYGYFEDETGEKARMNFVEGVMQEEPPAASKIYATTEADSAALINERLGKGDGLELLSWIYIEGKLAMVAVFRPK